MSRINQMHSAVESHFSQATYKSSYYKILDNWSRIFGKGRQINWRP
jgi:hypothetical protein